MQSGNGSPNFEMDEHTFMLNRERAVDYLNMLDRLYVFDGYAGWDPQVLPPPPSPALAGQGLWQRLAGPHSSQPASRHAASAQDRGDVPKLAP